MLHEKIAIVALASPPDFEKLDDADHVWTINNTHDIWDCRTDQIIAMDDLQRDEHTHPKYVQSIVNAGVPVMSTEAKEKWPNVGSYPLKRVCNYLKAFHNDPCRLLDNTCNYALALGMANGYREIHAFGVAWCLPYGQVDLINSLTAFNKQGFKSPPDWFKYYHRDLMIPRRSREPGSESWHFLMGVAAATGISIIVPEHSTLLNQDRDKFFYGYQDQPDVT